MGDFYIMFYSVVVGIIASRRGPPTQMAQFGGGVVHPNIFSSVLDKSQK